MASLFDFLPMVVAQNIGPQRFTRTPEPNPITDTPQAVDEYNQVMMTKLSILYAVGLEVIYRARPEGKGARSALDLACGPGHYTLYLANYLGYEQVTGIDLSPAMIQAATQNAKAQGLEERVKFHLGDITRLDLLVKEAVDLTCFMHGAHHMPDLPTVAKVLREMDRITKPEGLIMVMDLHRLRTAALTENYLSTFGRDYIQRGFSKFFDDFHHSMYAAWTAQELRSALPPESRRWWCHCVPLGLPTTQIILGLPMGRKQAFIRPCLSTKWNPQILEWLPRWEEGASPRRARETLQEWKLARWSLFAGSRRLIPPRDYGIR